MTPASFFVQFFNIDKSEKVDKTFKKVGVYTGSNISRHGIFYPNERERLERAGLKVVVIEYCRHNPFKYGIFVSEEEKGSYFGSLFSWLKKKFLGD